MILQTAHTVILEQLEVLQAQPSFQDSIDEERRLIAALREIDSVREKCDETKDKLDEALAFIRELRSMSNIVEIEDLLTNTDIFD